MMDAYPAHQRLKLHAGISFLPLNRYDDALMLFEGLRQSWGDADVLLGLIGYTHARRGDRQSALGMLSRLDSLAAERPVSAFHTGVLLLGLGETEAAIASLEEAYEERTWLMTLIAVEPMFDLIRGHPRFDKLVRAMGLESAGT